MKNLYISLMLLLHVFPLTGYAQNKFKLGDEVEVFTAGDATHGIIVGEYQNTDYGYGTYQVHLNGEKYCSNHATDTRYNATYVNKRFQPDSKASFAVGSLVDVRRYNGNTYTGKIMGKDGEKYEVRYKRDGFETSDWFHVYNIRKSKNEVAVAEPAKKAVKDAVAAPKPGKTRGVTASTAAGIKVGDRVMYDELGFLTGKNFGKVVSYDPEKRQYTVRDEKDASWKYTYPCYNVLLPGQTPNNNFFIGKWEVHVLGATSTFTKNGDVYRRFSGGMKLPPLEVKANGTYTWVTQDNKVIRGKWIARDGVPGIVLLKAVDGLDYTLYEKTEAFATTAATRDEIGIHHVPSSTGYYHAYRIGANKSCVLSGRVFKK
ncbi:hypothetical protein [Botryobacter ruber]|uniref:hypothetical protein n=1 Tax=Botryobacter ruber TaxID=2171629 RepID=UPI000E0B8354|nr:hypothetical protein [Botryobacter ruber]